MLGPDYLDELPAELVRLWQQVEDDILREAAWRLGQLEELDPLTPTTAWQLYRLAETQALQRDIVRLLAKYSGRSDAAIRRALTAGCTQALGADDAIHRLAHKTPGDVNASPALRNLLNAGYRQTRGSWRNLTATTAATVAPQFAAAMDRAWLQVASGAFSYTAAIRQTVEGLAGDLKTVTYPSGHRDRLEVAVRRCVLTGVNQTAAKLQLARMQEMGCRHVEVTAHAGARSDGSKGPRDHAWWQGKVYSLGDLAEDVTQGRTGDGAQTISATQTGTDTAPSQSGRTGQARGRWRDVTQEYLDAATPGVGSVAMDEGYKVGGHAAEIKTAQWLHETLGGDIRLLKESLVEGHKTPDYVWNGLPWELKNVSSIKAVDSALRGALRQIAGKAGGIILDCGDSKCTLSEILDAINYRILRSQKADVDILVLLEDELVKVIRYKKE